ncbi:MAG: hypothetical protein J6C98_08670 [Oscillospiraceae bacterium]|nr:hypothetical protein [Oscillospiraceae bacterium]
MKLDNKRGLLLRLPVLAAVAAVFLLFFSVSTSPLTNEYGGDSAFFMLVGQGMTKGMLPYRDFFDMKGPYLFLVEYIGQLICYGRTGAFLMQWVHLTACLWIADGIFAMTLGRRRASFLWELALMIPWLAVAAVTFEGGNLTEEYSLPWLMLAVYFALRYLRASEASGDWKHQPWIGFYYGFVFGYLALIRVTNAALIGAVILTISAGLLVKKEFKNLFVNGLMFIFGCAAAFAPMCVYYAGQGLLEEMLSQVFGFGVRYSAEVGMAQKLAGIPKRLVPIMLLPAIVPAIRRQKDWRIWMLTLSAVGLFLVAAVMGNGYLHYMTLGIPNLVLALALAAEGIAGEKRDMIRGGALAVLAVLSFALLWPKLQHQIATSTEEIRIGSQLFGSRAALLEMNDQIPAEDSVYTYGHACSAWYARTGRFPGHRYCDWQEHYITLNPEVGDELAAWLGEENPDWIVIPLHYQFAPQQIAQVVADHYHEYSRNGAYILLKANG